jgi:ABC-type multidrug transport system fused ATPase/permease subunit
VARAILKKAPILLLDEPTSALDTESEILVQEALDKVMDGRTTIIVTHRYSTIKAADEILVLDKGSIVQKGKHDELIALDGIYKQLYERQFSSDGVDGGEAIA